MANIGIFRGIFDPIEKSSFDVAKELIIKMNIDVMVFVPAFIDEEKVEGATKKEHRANMVKLVVSKHPKMAFDDIEMNLHEGEKISIVSMMRHFKRTYETDNIYLFVDSNELQTMNTWEGLPEIQEISTIIVYPLSKNYIRDNISKYFLTTVNLSVFANEGEYHKGRLEATFPIVQDYIGKNFLYIDSLLNSFLDLNQHQIAVQTARFAKELALRNGADPKKAYLAGLLLWIGYGSNANRKIKYLGMKGIDMTYMHEGNYDGPFTAMWLKHEYKIRDEAILNAVYHHTFIEAGMTRLDQIVYMSHKFLDKAYANLVDVYKEDILYDFDYVWSTYMLALGMTYKKVRGKNITRDPKTIEAIIEYAKGRFEEKRMMHKMIPGENRKYVTYVPLEEYNAFMEQERARKQAVLDAVELEKQKIIKAAEASQKAEEKRNQLSAEAAEKEKKKEERIKAKLIKEREDAKKSLSEEVKLGKFMEEISDSKDEPKPEVEKVSKPKAGPKPKKDPKPIAKKEPKTETIVVKKKPKK